MRFRNPIFGILSLVVVGLLFHIFKETSWAIFVERLLEEAAHSYGIERAAMIATLAQILIGGGLLWAALYFAFRVGRAERPIPPDPAVEAARAHTEALREQTAAFLTGPPKPPDEPLKAPAPSGPTWLELEKRFNDLEPVLQFSSIHGQTGSSGEYWRVAGGHGRDAEDRFNAVAAMASAKLFREFGDEVDRRPELARETDPAIRWYKALQYIGGRYREHHVGREVNDDGSYAGHIYTGMIEHPAAASATLCLAIASR